MNLRSHAFTAPSRGFSLIEMMGVLTVMAILASVMVPPLLKRLHLEAAQEEDRFLDQVSWSLKNHLRRHKTFPDATTWADTVAQELGLAAEDILQTPQQGERLFLIDPALRLGGSEDGLPFTQVASGSISPVSPRILVLANLDGHKSIPLTSGVADPTVFDDLWNLPANTIPPSWGTLWQTSPDDLKILRLDLGPLFHRLILNTYDSAAPGQYALDLLGPEPLPQEGFDAYLVEGTLVHLHRADASLALRHLLGGPAAFTYAREAWRGQIFQELQLAVDGSYETTSFLAFSAENPQAPPGNTIADAIQAMTEYMVRYREWDDAGFPPGGPIRSTVLDAQDALALRTANLTLE